MSAVIFVSFMVGVACGVLVVFFIAAFLDKVIRREIEKAHQASAEAHRPIP